MDPLPQQDLMTEFMLQHDVSAIFADPGLGKSRATIDAIKALKAQGKTRGVLIVAPLRVTTLTWPNEIDKWGGLTYANLRTPQGITAWCEGSADVYLINYEMLPKFVTGCLKGVKSPFPVDMVVWDELSKARNHASSRIKAFLPYRKKFSRHVGLTGTPTPNSVLDLFAQIRLLDGGERLGPAYFAFRNRYAESDFMGYNWTPRPGADESIRERIKDMALVLRSQDWLDIPPVTVEDIDVVLPDDVMKQYKQMQKEMLVEIESSEITALSAASLVQKLSQFASGATYVTDDDGVRTVVPIHKAKTYRLMKLHQSLDHAPMLVFTQFKHEVERIKAEIPWAQEFDESKMVQWNAGEIPMWIAHPKAMAHGLSLQGTCHHVCWFTLGYSNEDYIQGNARIARTGQKNPTTIYRLLATKTVDWAMAETLRSKEDGQSALKDALKHIKTLALAK